MLGLSGWELIVVLLVLLLLFGSRLPSVMRSLGRSATEFKRGMNDIADESIGEPKQTPVAKQDTAPEKPSDASPAG